MESSGTVTDSADFCIGSIVWVRRRNGSWWPGKILGPDELSASNIMSPRSGTPVKLLGREDASVDWYNLEKSKRVKAFRCGEFEDCIQRVEASLGLPPKKREKYARREDAILHALELEKELMEKKHVMMGFLCNEERESVVPLEIFGNGRGENSLGHESPRCPFPVPEKQSTRKSGDLFDNDHLGSRKSISASQMGNSGLTGFNREAASGSVEDTETDTAGTDEDNARLSEDDIVTVLEPKSSRSSELQWKHGNTSNEEHGDFASGGGNTSILCSTPIASSSPIAVSKWKLKGKRNSRGIGKRPIHHIRDNNNILPNSKSSISERDSFDGPDDTNHRSQSVLNNKRQSLTAKSAFIDAEYADHDMMAWEESSWNDHERRLLLDVEVKVQASYQRRQDVPMTSLISKLNGHAIVGHPIPVEPIEESDPPMVRTAKRSRPDEVADFKGKQKKPSVGKKKNKKKRISLLSPSSQKIKTLSSIGRHKDEELLEGGLMKGDTKTGFTAVACIPVKLVFSRLHEKLINRHH